jgi:hypothetical protein
VKDGAFPISVSPGAMDAGLPKTSADDGARLVLLTQTGNSITGLNSSPEPTPFGARLWRSSGTPDLWNAENVIAASEQRLETAAPGAFRLSLIDDDQNPVTDGEFVVHLCPRFEHWAGAPECPTPASVTSVNGVVSSVTVNDGGLGRGYLGIELKKAPLAPGTYYVNVESLDGAYRVRGQSDFVTEMDPAAGEYQGGFALCTVQGAEFLDANFARIKPLLARQPTPAYLRYVSAGTPPDSRELLLRSYRSTGPEFGAPTPIAVLRLGKSNVSLGQLTLVPEGDPPAAAAAAGGRMAVLAPPVAREVPPCRSRLVAEAGDTIAADTPVDINCKLLIEWVSPEAPDVTLPEQYTVIEGENRNYAEKTYLRISVVNPHDGNQPVPDQAPPCALLRELPMNGSGPANEWPVQDPPRVFTGVSDNSNPYDNNREHGGDVLDGPGLPVELREAVSTGRDGETAFFLRAVARRRFLNGSSPAEPLVDFGALLTATACPFVGVIDDAEPTLLEMWVDQVDYFPRSPAGPTRHVARRGDTKTSIDWFEKEAFDILQAPLQGPLSWEVDAFASVEMVTTENYRDPGGRPTEKGGARTGYVLDCPYRRPQNGDDHHIHFNPFIKGLRWGYGAEANTTTQGVSDYRTANATFTYGIGRRDLFETLLSHEARHSLFNKISLDSPSNDPEANGWVTSIAANGVTLVGGTRMLESRSTLAGGSNPEFHVFQGTACSSLNFLALSPAMERDALLNARNSTVHLQFGGVDGSATLPELAPYSENNSFLLPALNRSGIHDASPTAYALWGNLSVVEVTAGGCQVRGDGSESWSNRAAIPVWATMSFRVLVSTASVGGGTCHFVVTPQIPDDATGALLPGQARNYDVVVRPFVTGRNGRSGGDR